MYQLTNDCKHSVCWEKQQLCLNPLTANKNSQDVKIQTLLNLDINTKQCANVFLMTKTTNGQKNSKQETDENLRTYLNVS